MNRILLALNAILVLAVAFLFYRSFNNAPSEAKISESETVAAPEAEKKVTHVASVASTPTGKLAYVNIDRLNDESLEIIDLVAETKRRKNSIEAAVESLSMQYQQKVEEFQISQKAGIAPQSEMESKAREIQRIEQEAQNKQLQMDNLSMDINEKNLTFQKNVREFLTRWNQGRYDFVLSYSESVPSMLMGNSTLEVTDEIITEINKEYKQRKGKK